MSKLLQSRSVVASAAALLVAFPSVTQDGAQFYKGKTVTYIVATASEDG